MLSCFGQLCFRHQDMQVAQSLAQENRLWLCANLSLAPSPADEGALYFVRN